MSDKPTPTGTVQTDYTQLTHIGPVPVHGHPAGKAPKKASPVAAIDNSSPEAANAGFYQPTSAGPNTDSQQATSHDAKWLSLYQQAISIGHLDPDAASVYADNHYSDGADPNDLPVYWQAPAQGPASEAPLKEIISSESDANRWLLGVMTSDPVLWNQIRDQMIAAGVDGLDATARPDQVITAWANLVHSAALNYNSGKGDKQTPFDVLGLYGMRNPNSAYNLAATNGVVTTVDRHTSSTLDSASAIATNVMREAQADLGKNLSPAAQNAIVSQIQELEKAHPGTSTTTTKRDAKGNTTSNTVGVGGFDPTISIQKEIQDQPTYAEHQAATTYFNALMNALGGLNSAGT